MILCRSNSRRLVDLMPIALLGTVTTKKTNGQAIRHFFIRLLEEQVIHSRGQISQSFLSGDSNSGWQSLTYWQLIDRH
jgi:hypothetical protein